MRILVFYQYFGTPKGGWSTRYYEFTRRWVAAGHQVTVVTSPYYKSDIRAEGFVSRQSVEGVKLIVIDSPDSNKDSFLKRAWNAARFAMVSLWYALSVPHDIVISSSGPISTAVPGLLSKWIRRKKFAFEVRDLWPKGGIEMGKLSNPMLRNSALFFEKTIYINSDLVIACSEGMEKGVLDVWPSTKTLVITNSSDISLFAPSGDLPSFPEKFDRALPIFVYTGSLGEMDECSQILRGLSQVKSSRFNLVFIGDGADRGHLERLAKTSSSPAEIYFLGLISKIEVIKWLGLATASFVTFKNLPVLHTSSPNKMFDSFAAGVPIIQSTKGWIFSLVEKEKCGLNVDPDSPHQFARAIEFLIENPEQAKLMGQAALNLAKTRFNRDILSEAFLSGLKKTVD